MTPLNGACPKPPMEDGPANHHNYDIVSSDQ